MKKIWKNIFLFFTLYIFILWFYSKKLFGSITADQIHFYTQCGIDIVSSDMKPIIKLLRKSFLLTSLILLVFVIFFRCLCLISKKTKILRSFKSKFLSYISFLLIFISVYTICSDLKLLDLVALKETTKENDFIKENYVDPNTVDFYKGKNKNLVLIYVESLEKTYRNDKIFSENLLRNLDELPGYEFENYIQTPNTEWTIAAIVGTQCGVPLKPIFTTKETRNITGELAKEFLASVTCLGNTLEKEGYYNEYMQGASLSFSGKNKFLKNHGYKTLRGRDEWLKSNYTLKDMNNWGLYDDLLIQEAKLILDKLVASKKLFNFTILTVDTHFPNGHLSKTCANAGGKTIQDVIKCTTNEVAKFVKYMIKKGYLEHTNIVILGDHLTMPNSIYDLVEKEPKRTIYNKWISKEPFIANKNTITHFDIAPTILDFIGIKVMGGRYGLGYSGYGSESNDYPPGLIDDYFLHLNKRSIFYNSLWKKK